jgi:hypothetical protein
LDVKAKGADGKRFNIEIQISDEAIEIAKLMLSKNKPIDEIMEFTGLSEFEINKK